MQPGAEEVYGGSADGPAPCELERVYGWRLEQALTLGLPLGDAEEFAVSDGDLAALRRLVAAGCAPVLAAAILI